MGEGHFAGSVKQGYPSSTGPYALREGKGAGKKINPMGMETNSKSMETVKIGIDKTILNNTVSLFLGPSGYSTLNWIGYISFV